MRLVLIPRIAALLGVVAVAAACGTDDPSVVAEQRDKPVVLTALRPLAELAQTIGGSDVVVVNLTPVGRSPHELQLTPRERAEVAEADLTIVVGRGFQPALERAAAERDHGTVSVLDDLELPNRPDAADGPVDPHVWLDPTILGSIATLVGEQIAKVVPAHASAIEARAHDLVERDVQLDAQLEQGLSKCRLRTLVTQHESFGWFAARYGLTELGLDGPLPDGDPAPDPAYVAKVEPHLEDGSVATLFQEELSPSSWMEVLAQQHGLGTEVLDPYEGLTPEQEADGLTYREAMLETLKTLEDELDCGAA
jgi:zinc transport system substrate-binding protein